MPAVVKDAESRAAGISYGRLPDERLQRLRQLQRYHGSVTTVLLLRLRRFVTTVTTVRYNGSNGYNSYNGYERSREHATLDTLQEAGSRAGSSAVTVYDGESGVELTSGRYVRKRPNVLSFWLR